MDHIKPLLALSISTLILAFLVKHYRGSKLPPGPRGLPIVGNILDLQKLLASNEKPWVAYLKWSHLYGDVFTFHVLGSRTVILNSYKAIMDLLEHRSHNYSDRPLMRYSEDWRLHRKAFHEYFQPRVVPQYYDLQREKTSLLIQNLGTSPKDFFEHVRAHMAGLILEIIYGYKNQDSFNSYVKLVDRAMAGLNEAGVGKYLVDYFPILKFIPVWFPGAYFKRRAQVWARDTDRLRDLPWEMIKNLMDDGTAVPCFCTQNLENDTNDIPDMERVIRNCAATAFLGRKLRTVSAILSFILAMVLHPEIQARAQKELDEVTGITRLPDFSDRENLPYIDAILAEVLRWNPVAPFALPHRAVNDDIYEGYLIPGGKVLISCDGYSPHRAHRAVLRDESLFGPDPAKFNPDRFLKQDGKNLPPNPEPLAFGFGRRACPGRYLAVNSLWLAMTYLLANFTIAKEVDTDGKKINPVAKYSVGITSHPLPFKCRFIPRPSAPAFN
ncbi:cytochrome P450 [Marasmius fiardii PR-910]|nr:cytochrome P450 [Marasmius fiardii PR-910]